MWNGTGFSTHSILILNSEAPCPLEPVYAGRSPCPDDVDAGRMAFTSANGLPTSSDGAAQDAGGVPGRTIPADADSMALRAGGRLLRKHTRFGAALVSGTAAPESTLRSDPNVEYVVEDRPVTASPLQVRTADAKHVSAPSVHTSAPTMAMPPDGPDAFYTDSPQGWAVRVMGGYGGGIAGDPEAGPWLCRRARGVRIAVLDSDVDRTHLDIAPNLLLNISEID